jgi:hypothetical protein
LIPQTPDEGLGQFAEGNSNPGARAFASPFRFGVPYGKFSLFFIRERSRRVP